MRAVTVLRHYCDTLVEGVELGFLAQASCSGVLGILPERQALSVCRSAPFEVVGAFGMAFRLAVYSDEVRLDAPVRRQDNGAIPHALAGYDAFGEVYFFGLSVGHRCHLRFHSESVKVSPAYNLLKKKVVAEREGYRC